MTNGQNQARQSWRAFCTGGRAARSTRMIKDDDDQTQRSPATTDGAPKPRGFAAMDPTLVSELAKRGGRAAHRRERPTSSRARRLASRVARAAWPRTQSAVCDGSRRRGERRDGHWSVSVRRARRPRHDGSRLAPHRDAALTSRRGRSAPARLPRQGVPRVAARLYFSRATTSAHSSGVASCFWPPPGVNR